eukprot:TRINITY_DN8176_c0_g1_i1.p1 TRINITY_DN8176_c0_g1~~TRINITY_DN8176_c0_g1_i1.p1  ORF type:complete len:260 (+),score=83.20 TRINITY_DN8176_c0_g1_i1:43-780(+)
MSISNLKSFNKLKCLTSIFKKNTINTQLNLSNLILKKQFSTNFNSNNNNYQQIFKRSYTRNQQENDNNDNYNGNGGSRNNDSQSVPQTNWIPVYIILSLSILASTLNFVKKSTKKEKSLQEFIKPTDKGDDGEDEDISINQYKLVIYTGFEKHIFKLEADDKLNLLTVLETLVANNTELAIELIPTDDLTNGEYISSVMGIPSQGINGYNWVLYINNKPVNFRDSLSFNPTIDLKTKITISYVKR